MPTDRPEGIEVVTPSRIVERYVANPLLSVLLRSPLHGLVSDSLLLLSYEGRASGSRYTIPVGYEGHEGELFVSTLRRRANWWRNFTGGHPCVVRLRGERRAGRGVAITNPEEIAEWAHAYLGRHGLERARWLGLSIDGDDPPSLAALERVADRLVLVRLSLER